MDAVKIGSKWYGSDFREVFVVEMVYQNDAGVWVTYISTKTNRVHDCLVGAFLNRFTEKRNDG